MRIIFILIFLTNILNSQIPEGKKITSYLYIYDFEKNKSILISKENRHIEAPNWFKNEDYLILNSRGKLEKYSSNGENMGIINTQELEKCNNDHGISFDGSTLFFSSGKNEIKGHSSFIYKVPIEGGIPELITSLSPSYWHGVSPDGKDIVYCAERDGNYDVYKMNISQGKEIKLTSFSGLDDGPEYSNDGKYIYYNSYKSGKMKIWRMLADGSDKTQLTFDDFSDWFPHVSPNDKNILFISYINDQKQRHPFGRKVKLRLLNINTHKIKDLTPVFFGGQGTINVNSWNSEGTKFAYVIYSLENF